jgi:hypothetical protein
VQPEVTTELRHPFSRYACFGAIPHYITPLLKRVQIFEYLLREFSALGLNLIPLCRLTAGFLIGSSHVRNLRS